MGAFVLGIPEHQLRVVAPDVGGGFGSKIFHYGEEAFVTRAAQVRRPAGEMDRQPLRGLHLRRPGPRPRHEDRARPRRGRQVPRLPHRDARQHRRLPLDSSRTCTPTYLHGPAAGRPLRTPLIYVNVKAVFTNTVPVDAYRGAGRPEGTYQLERVVDKAARELGIDPVEIRRKQLRQARRVPLPDPGRGASTTPATTTPPSTSCSRSPTTPASPPRRAESEGARQAARLRRLHLGRGLRPRAVAAHRRARRPRRPLRERRRCG